MATVTSSVSSFTPSAVLSADVGVGQTEQDLADALHTANHDRAHVLVRLCGEPIANVELDVEQALRNPVGILDSLATELQEAEDRHGHSCFASADSDCRWIDSTETAWTNAQPISVVVCTSGHRPDGLRRTLERISNLRHPNFELVLVDNAAEDDSNARVLSDFSGRVDCRYVTEPIRGLARARNTGLHHSRNNIIVYTDDDVVVDPNWLLAIEHGFKAAPRVGLVTGPVLPAEIETEAQYLFERNGGHSKGRGFRRAILGDPGSRQSPYFPLPPFAVGCSLAFRREALVDAGGFDPALGAGLPTQAGEDTAAITEMLTRGWTVAYEPAAVMWHYHRRDMASLHAQYHAYGIGLGAYYASILNRDPRRILPIARLLPRAALAIAHTRTPEPSSDITSVSTAVQRSAIIKGVGAYRRSKRLVATANRRVSQGH
jgi:O-antigen biosynthesis protein